MTAAGPSTPSQSPDEALSAFVGGRVSEFQARYLADDASVVATLARLRRAVGRPVGADPDVWATLLDRMPAGLIGRGDAPSPWEQAAHDALTVYAVHQQSRDARMHVPGVGLGTAVRRLADGAGAEEAVRRRFQALATSSSREETLHHLRGLVTQLRAHSVPLDHARLARDLRRLHDPRWGDAVRLQWGRDYHRVRSEQEAESSLVPDPTGATRPAAAAATTPTTTEES